MIEACSLPGRSSDGPGTRSEREFVDRARRTWQCAEQFDDVPVAVREARLTVAPGIRQRGGFFDLQWWHNGDYRYHYQETGLQFRFGREADDEPTTTPVDHFHPPSDPGEHRLSCVPSEQPPELVTLAVIANWLHAARESDPDLLNSLTDPP